MESAHAQCAGGQKTTMAADGVISRIDPLSDDIQLSDYAKKLPIDARRRYVVKRLYNYGQDLLPDPYMVTSDWSDDPTVWPPINFGHIYCYLIDTPGTFTRESLNAYKSLDAYRYVESGHVQIVEIHNIGDNVPFCAVRAKVTPSQRISEKTHRPWAYLDKETQTGSVFCAHCTCLAGLGEVCSHVAALLFKMEIGVKYGVSRLSATSELCKWNQTFRKQLEPVTIEQLQPLMNGGRSKPVVSEIPSGKDSLPDISLLESLKAVCPNAVFFTTIPPLDPEETETASETGEHQQHVQSLRDLHRDFGCTDAVTEDSAKRVWEHYKCSEEQVKELERETRGQSVCPTWYEQRKGRITGTKAHDVLVRKSSTKPENLVRLITGSKCYNLANKKSIQWGNAMEEHARSAYVKLEKNKHSQLNVADVGLLIDHKKPFLAVSADGVVTCECCETRLLEIKCPYKQKDKKVSEVSDRDFCLDKNGRLKPTHRYYTQVQFQLYVYGLNLCHLFVYTNKDSVTVPVTRDDMFCSNLVAKCEQFFFKNILPEILTRKLENSSAADIQEESRDTVSEAADTDRDVWCLCQEPEYGRMIECSNVDCPTRWFHYECVNIRRCPRGKWFCPECSDY